MEKETILAGLDPEVLDEVTSRRGALLGMGRMSAKLALASAPLAVAAMARQAFAQTTLPANIAAVLNFALILEELEAEFYTIATGGMAMSGGTVVTNLIPSQDRPIFDTLRDHEQAHVRFLRQALGSQAVAKPTFDFTAGGAFPTVFTSYATFLTLSQAFEDTGVRAYKGQAGNLFANKDILTAALTIHSVEARHASEVRRLRGNFSEQAPQKGWITGNQSGGAPAAVYAGEENSLQGGISLPQLNGITAAGVTPAVPASAVTEAFDEPLTRAQVVAIVDPFIVEPIS